MVGVLQALEASRKPSEAASDLKPEIDRLKRAVDQLRFQARQEAPPPPEPTPDPLPASFFHLTKGYPEEVRLARLRADLGQLQQDCGCSNCADFGSATILYS